MAWALLACSLAQAQPAPKVLLVDPGDPELAARIAGQTRDLPLRFEAAARAASFDRARAQALANANAAAAVVWTAPGSDGGLEVHVLDALRGSERTRAVPRQPEGEQLGGSAVFEAAALVVRGELSNLLEQEALAARAAEAERTRTSSGTGPGGSGGTAPGGNRKPAEDDGKGSADDDDDDQGTPDQPYRPPGAWSVRAAARVALVGDDAVAYGPLLGVGLDVGRFAFGLQATTAWPIETEEQGVKLRFKRHGVAAQALFIALDARALRLLAGIDAGVVLYARDTPVVSGTLLAKGAITSLSASFGAVGELQWLPTRLLGAALTVGLDVLTAPTEFAVDRGGQQEVLRSLAVYEPWAMLSIVFRFGPPAD